MKTLQFRFAVRAFLFGLLLTVAAGMVPLRAQDQQPAASASAPSAQATPSASEPANAAKEEDDTAAFRHTPLITSIAKAIHLSVDTTARLFEIFNFAILFFGLGIPLARFLPKHLNNRKQVLRQNLESARKTSEEAKARLSAVEAQLSHLDEEIAKIRAQVEEESKQDEARIKAAMEEERGRIVAAAEQEIGVAATQAKRSLRHFAADLAIEQAAAQLELTAETDHTLIAEFVSSVTPNGAAGGGKN